MRILHFSDLHGRAFRVARQLVASLAPDWVVLTGDMMADPEWLPGEHRRATWQMRRWVRGRAHFIAPGLCTTLVRGNHEREGFADPELQAARPAALAQDIGVLEGIPAEFGPWGFPREMDSQALARELEGQGPRRIWLSHVPPYGILDRTRHGMRVGHRPLAQCLQGPGAPDLVLCGHVHEAVGVWREGRTQVVNAAGGYAHLTWDPLTGDTQILALETLCRYHPWIGFLAALRPGGG